MCSAIAVEAPFSDSCQARKRARGDRMYEHGPDDAACHCGTHKWPPWPVPLVHNTHEGRQGRGRRGETLSPWGERPFDVHAAGNSVYVAKPDAGISPAGAHHLHLCHPPDRPAKRPEAAVCRHGDQSATVRSTIAYLDRPIMRQMRWPGLNCLSELEHPVQRRAHKALIDRAHAAAARHRPKRERFSHCGRDSVGVSGVQDAVTR